jgi:hypothetical protein
MDVPCGVTIKDVEGSGIDVSTIQYRSSPYNLSRYGRWTDWEEGEWIDAVSVDTSVLLNLAEGSHNYIQWRAMDIVGNGYTTSLHYRVMVDVTPISFSDFIPIEDEFQNRDPVRCTVWTLDNFDGSGTDIESISCRFRSNGTDDFTPWQSVTVETGPDTTSVSAWLSLPEGSRNEVQFRGSDLAGNGPTLSEAYIVLVDKAPPVITLSEPPTGERLIEGNGLMEVLVEDGVSGVDHDSVLARFAPPDSDEWTEWLSMEGTYRYADFTATIVYSFQPGDGNRIQVQACDNASNLGFSEVFTFWVNSPPIAMIDTPTDGSTFTDEELVIFSSTGSLDPDGDDLKVSWSIEGETTIGFDGDGVERRLRPGFYIVTLTVEDGYEGADTASIVVIVTEREQSSWADNLWWLLLFILLVVLVLIIACLFVNRQGMVGQES